MKRVLTTTALAFLLAASLSSCAAPKASEVSASPSTQATCAASDVSCHADRVAAMLQDLPQHPLQDLSKASIKQYASHIDEAFPKGTTITVRRDTWREQPGYNTGQMTTVIHRPGEKAKTYVAIVVLEKGQWKFLTTVDPEDQP